MERLLSTWFVVLACILVLAGAAKWEGSNSDWNDGSNWDPAGVPGSGDAAEFYDGSKPTAITSSTGGALPSISNGVLQVTGSGATGTTTVSGGTLDYHCSGSSITINGGNHDIQSGTMSLTGSGGACDVNLNVKVTLSGGTMKVQRQSSVQNLFVTASSTIQGDKTVVSGSVSLSNQLTVKGVMTTLNVQQDFNQAQHVYTDQGNFLVSGSHTFSMGGSYNFGTGKVGVFGGAAISLTADTVITGGILSLEGALDSTDRKLAIKSSLMSSTVATLAVKRLSFTDGATGQLNGQVTVPKLVVSGNSQVDFVGGKHSIGKYDIDAGSSVDIKGGATLSVTTGNSLTHSNNILVESGWLSYPNAKEVTLNGSPFPTSAVGGIETLGDGPHMIRTDFEALLGWNTGSASVELNSNLRLSGSVEINGPVIVRDTSSIILLDGTTLTFTGNSNETYIQFLDASNFLYEGSVLFNQDITSFIRWNSTGSYRPPDGAVLFIDGEVVFPAGKYFLVNNASLQVEGGGTLVGKGTWELYMIGEPNSCLGEIKDGGRIRFEETALFDFFNSTFSVTEGSFTLQDDSQGTLNDTSLFVADEFTVIGNSTLSIVDGSFLNVTDTLLVGGNATVYTQLSQLDVSENVELEEESTTTMVNSTLNIAPFSSLIVDGTSLLEAYGSIINIATINANTSAGSMELFNGTVYLENSELFVDGRIYGYDQAQLTTTSTSNVTLAGTVFLRENAELQFSDYSSVLMFDGGFFQPGYLIALDEASIQVDSHSVFNISTAGSRQPLVFLSGGSSMTVDNFGVVEHAGSILINSDASLNIGSSSDFSIIGTGSLIGSTNGTVHITGGSSFLLEQGEAIFQDRNEFYIDHSIATLQSGDFIFLDYASVLGNQGIINVEGGNVSFAGNSTGLLEASSVLQVENTVVMTDYTHQVYATSTVNITVGSLLLDDFAHLSAINGSLIEIGTGNLLLSDNAKVTLDGVLNLRGGDFIASANSTVEINSDAIINVESGVLHFADRVIIDSGIRVAFNVSGSLIFSDFVIHQFITGTKATIDGVMRIEDYADIKFFDSRDLAVTGLVEVLDSGAFRLERSTVTVNGTITSNDTTTIDISDHTRILVDGQVLLSDAHDLSVQESTIEVSGTNALFEFIGNENSTVDSTASTFLVEEGNATFGGETVVNSVTTKFIVDGGFLRFQDKVTFSSQLVQIDVRLGDMIVTDMAFLKLAATSGVGKVDISGGDLLITGSTSTILEATKVLVTSGNAIISGSANFSMSGSDLDVVSGSFSFLGNSLVEASSSFLEVSGGQGGIIFDTTLPVNFERMDVSVSDGSMRFLNHTIVHAVNSKLGVTVGNCSFEEESKTFLTDSQIVVSSGRLDILTGSQVHLTNGSVEVTDGSISVSSIANLTLYNSPVSVQGGRLEVQDTGMVQLVDPFSTVSISGGILSLEDNANFLNPVGFQLQVSEGEIIVTDFVDVIFREASISVTSGGLGVGNVVIRREANATFLDSDISIVQGKFIVEHLATAILKNSNVTINGGLASFNTSETAIIDISDSKLAVTGGKLVFGNKTMPSITKSQLTVTDGSADFTENSDTTIEQSSVLVTNGRIYASGESIVRLPQTSLVVKSSNQGGVFLTDNSSLILPTSSSTVLVSGGDLHFDVTSRLIAVPGINVTVESGSCTFDSLSSTKVSGLNLFISSTSGFPGNFLITDQATVELDSSEIDIVGGRLIVDGLADLFIESSSISISGAVGVNGAMESSANFTANNISMAVDGSFTLSQAHQFFMASSELSISNGQTVFGGNNAASMTVVNSTILVAGGSVAVDLRLQPTFDNVNFTIRGGSLTCKKFSTMFFTDSSLSVDSVGAAITALLRAKLSFANTPIVITSGDMEFSAQSALLITDDQSPILVQGGRMSFIDRATCSLAIGAILNIQNGGVFFSGNTESSFDSVTISLSSSSKRSVEAAIEFTLSLDASLSVVNSKILVFSGQFQTFNDSTLYLRNTSLEIDGGNLLISDQSNVTIVDSHLAVSGSFVAAGEFSLAVLSSAIDIADGQFQISGSNFGSGSLTTATFEDTSITLTSLLSQSAFTLNDINIEFNDCSVDIEGGGLFAYGDTDVSAIDTFFNLTGQGSFVLSGETSMTLGSGSHFDINSNTASANFTDFAHLVIASGGSMNVTGGDIVFDGHSDFTLQADSFFFLVSGSFIAKGNADIVCLPRSKGKINGGALQVIENAQMSMFASEIAIEGSIFYDSTRPFLLIGNTTIVVNGEPVTISGTLSINDTSALVVQGSSLFFEGNGALIANNGIVLVSNGSIVMQNSTQFIALGGSEVTVIGTIDVLHSSTFKIGDGSTVSITSAGGEDGQLYISDNGTAIFENSFLYVTGGGILLDTLGELIIKDDTFTRVNGSVVLGGNSSATITDAIVEIANAGVLDLFGDSDFTVGSSTFNVSGAIVLDGVAELVITSKANASITDGGDLSAEEGSIVRVISSHLAISAGGEISLADNGTLEISESGIASLEFGDISMCGGRLHLYQKAELILENGNIDMKCDGRAVVDTQAVIRLLNGDFSVRNVSRINAASSGSILIFGDAINKGKLFFADNTTLALEDTGNVEIVGGIFDAIDYAKIFMREGRLELFDGETRFDNFVETIVTEKGTIALSGGTLSFLKYSTTELYDSLLKVDGGLMRAELNATVSLFGKSTFKIQQGEVQFANYAKFLAVDSTSTFFDGLLNLTDSSSCTITGGSMKIEFLGLSRAVSDLVILSDDATFTANFGALVEITSGILRFEGNSGAQIDGAEIRVTGGSVVANGGALAILNQGILTSIAGSVDVGSSATLSVDNASAKVTGGSLNVRGAAKFLASNGASVDVTGGRLLLSGSTSRISDSYVGVRGSGGLSIESSSTAIDATTIELSGGNLNVNAGTVDIDGTEITVSSGLFQFNGGSSNIKRSNFFMYSGDVRFLSSSQVSFTQSSNFTVFDGSVVLGGNARINVDSTAKFNVAGGNFIVTDGNRFNANGKACIIVTSTSSSNGNLIFEENSITNVDDSCFYVTGGNAIFQGNAKVGFTSESILDVVDGGFITKNTTTVTVDDSKISVSGGDYESKDNSSVIIRNKSVVDVSLGSAIWGGFSRTIVEGDSEFGVTGGDAIFADYSEVKFDPETLLKVSLGSLRGSGYAAFWVNDGSIAVSGGLLELRDNSQINIFDSNVLISLGSVHIRDMSRWTLDKSLLEIGGGNLVFSEMSNSVWTRAEVRITNGLLAALDGSNIRFESSSVRVSGGSLHILDRANMTIFNCEFSVGGDFTMGDHATAHIQDAQLTVAGDFNVYDSARLTVVGTRVKVLNGNMVFKNVKSDDRQAVLFDDCTVTVERSSQQSENNGHMSVLGWVDVNFRDSRVRIDGDLSVFGEGLLNLTSSQFHVQKGSVQLDRHGRIELHDGSVLLNQGYMHAPGVIEYSPEDAVSNEGIFESTNRLSVNCESNTNQSPFVNTGRMTLAQEEEYTSCIDSLSSNGVMELNGAHVSFRELQQQESGVTMLTNAYVELGDSVFSTSGSVSGVGTIAGDVDNFGSILAQQGGEATDLTVEGLFRSSPASWSYFIINSLDLNEKGAITHIAAGDVAITEGAKACVCVNPELQGNSQVRINLLEATNNFDGRFEQVQFGCAACPFRRARAVAGEEACDATESYGSRNMAVVFSGCGGRDDGNVGDQILAIEPPIYIVLPVGFAVFCVVTIGFAIIIGLSEKRRKSDREAKLAGRRKKNISELAESYSSNSTV